MFWRTVSSLGLVAMALSLPVPDHPIQGGFQPIHGSRGPSGPNAGYNAAPAPTNQYSPAPTNQYSGGSASAGPSVGPSKTIYVNVPPAQAAAAPAPIAAGPPRKHYKIVFIRAPAPPPAPQAILPPRTEQKTLIYVLHQRPQAQQQEIIEVPTVKHSPEVYFVQYDNPPTAEELQQLTAGDLGGLPYSPPGLTDFNTQQFRTLPEAGPGSPNLIQADEAAIGAVSPADAPVFFDPQPAAPAFDALPAAADATDLIIVDPAFAAPSGGVPIGAIDGGFGGAPAGGVSLQDAAAIFSDLGPVPTLPAAPVAPAGPASPTLLLPVAPSQVGVPLTSSVGSAPSSSVGVALSDTVGFAPSGGRIGVALDETITPGGSTIAAGVGGAVAPETFPFELGDAFGQRTVQRRR